MLQLLCCYLFVKSNLLFVCPSDLIWNVYFLKIISVLTIRHIDCLTTTTTVAAAATTTATAKKKKNNN